LVNTASIIGFISIVMNVIYIPANVDCLAIRYPMCNPTGYVMIITNGGPSFVVCNVYTLLSYNITKIQKKVVNVKSFLIFIFFIIKKQILEGSMFWWRL